MKQNVLLDEVVFLQMTWKYLTHLHHQRRWSDGDTHHSNTFCVKNLENPTYFWISWFTGAYIFSFLARKHKL